MSLLIATTTVFDNPYISILHYKLFVVVGVAGVLVGIEVIAALLTARLLLNDCLIVDQI